MRARAERALLVTGLRVGATETLSPAWPGWIPVIIFASLNISPKVNGAIRR